MGNVVVWKPSDTAVLGSYRMHVLFVCLQFVGVTATSAPSSAFTFALGLKLCTRLACRLELCSSFLASQKNAGAL
jgi:hypothetical protein